MSDSAVLAWVLYHAMATVSERGQLTREEERRTGFVSRGVCRVWLSCAFAHGFLFLKFCGSESTYDVDRDTAMVNESLGRGSA